MTEHALTLLQELAQRRHHAEGREVRVGGIGFTGGSDYRCRFGACGTCNTSWSRGACVVNGTYVGPSEAGLSDDAAAAAAGRVAQLLLSAGRRGRGSGGRLAGCDCGRAAAVAVRRAIYNLNCSNMCSNESVRV